MSASKIHFGDGGAVRELAGFPLSPWKPKEIKKKWLPLRWTCCAWALPPSKPRHSNINHLISQPVHLIKPACISPYFETLCKAFTANKNHVHTRGCWLLWHRQPLWLILWIYCWLVRTNHRPISQTVWLKVPPCNPKYKSPLACNSARGKLGSVQRHTVTHTHKRVYM